MAQGRRAREGRAHQAAAVTIVSCAPGVVRSIKVVAKETGVFWSKSSG